MIGTVWEVQFTDEDFHINLQFKPRAELYEKCLECTRGGGGGGGGAGGGVEERDTTGVDEEELEEEQDPHVRTTSSERISYTKLSFQTIFIENMA